MENYIQFKVLPNHAMYERQACHCHLSAAVVRGLYMTELRSQQPGGQKSDPIAPKSTQKS